jgi:DNA-binding transcriptional LysR family regulator
MKYDLKWINTFVRVAQLKSFVRAADVLNISKSHVTTIINQLEKNVGIPLLARTTREVNLTNDGLVFLKYCQEILDKFDQLDEFLDNHKEINGTLRIVIPPYFSRYHIVPYLEEFLSLYPKLKLDISLTENPVHIIEEGYDLQIRIQIPSEENLEVTHLMTNHKVICASSEYIKKFGNPSNPNDLVNHNCIIFGENKIWEFCHKETKEIIKLSNLSGNLRCDNGEIIKELVLSGIGLTIKSSRDIQDEIKSGQLIELLKDYEVLHQTKFYAVYPSSKINSPKIKSFINFFKNKLNQI